MALFRRFFYSKLRDRHLENSDWVFVEDPSSPAEPSTAPNGGASPCLPPIPAGDGSAAPSPPPPLADMHDVPTSHSQAEASTAEKTVPSQLDFHTPELLGGVPPLDPPPPPPLSPPRHGGPRVGRSSLKPLHWNKVNMALEGSLWEELQTHGQPPSAPEIDVSELEELFSSMSPKKAGSKEAEKRKASISIPEKVQLIDPVRANNMEIMLKELKLPPPYIVDAVLAMDDTVVDLDQVENLLKFFPTKDEMEILKSYTGDQDRLGKCEQYFLELVKVPRMESKLNAFMYKFQFSSQLAELKKSLNTINSACDEVRKSVKMKEIMKIILFMGNTLNRGTPRGSAVGFKLDSLLRLTDTRASNSNKTLMHYLCKLVATKLPALLDFHEDLVSLEAASKIRSENLPIEWQALSNGLRKVKQELDASANDDLVFAGFHMTLKGFVEHAETELRNLANFFCVVHC